MPDGVAYPFDPGAAVDAFHPPRSRSDSNQPTRARPRADIADLGLLIDLLEAFDQGWPALVERFREHCADPRDFALALDAPFGIAGPSLLELGDLRALFFKPTMIQSAMRVSDPTRLLLDYTRVMMGFLLCCPAPRRIEIIGLGGGSLAKYCHRYLPATEIIAIEIDPRVIALRDRFAIPRDDAGFRVICADGAEFVRSASGRPEVILVDGFDANGQADRLSCLEFYRDCRKRLSEGGILVVNLCGEILARRTAKSRLRRAFDAKVEIVPIPGRQNRVAFASRGPSFPAEIDQLLRTATELKRCHGIDFVQLASRLSSGD